MVRSDWLSRCFGSFLHQRRPGGGGAEAAFAASFSELAAHGGARSEPKNFVGLEPLEPRLLLSVSPLGVEPPEEDAAASTAVFAPAETESAAPASRPATHTEPPIVESTNPSPFVNVTFDYTYDTNNFFDTQEKRDLLDLAADAAVGTFTNALAAIEPEGTNTWSALFTHPGTGESTQVDDLVVAEREFVIFAGGRDLDGPLGQGGPGGFSVSGSTEWRETVRGRGQEGALDDPATAFARWGGMVTFDTEASWHFDETTSGLTTSEFDFLSVAMHEVIHVLGFTSNIDAFANHVDEDNVTFTGPRATALYEGQGHPPLAGADDLSHWESGFTHGGEVSVMTPNIAPGERQEVTAVDIATLEDIGWKSMAQLLADDVHTEGLSEHQFTVVYDSTTDLDVDTLINNNEAIRVTGPDGFDAFASYHSIDEATDGPMREVTYTLAAPGGGWAADDEGTYVVELESEQVADVHGTYVPAGTLGAFQVEIDTAPPSTAVQLTGTAGEGPWFRSAVEVKLDATDDLSGVDTIEYHFGDEDWQPYADPFMFDHDGVTTIHYRATDNAGNVEDPNTRDIFIDTVAPTTTHQLTGEVGEGDWFTSDVTVSLDATDDVSGVDTIEYHLGDGSWQTYDSGADIVVADEGVTTLHYRATDEAGNVETTQTVDVHVDTVAPVSTAAFDGEQGNDPWYISAVSVTLDASDDTSGVAVIEYRLNDEDTWQTYDQGAELVLSEQGETTLHHRAIDHAGHIEDAQTQSVFIDTVAPGAALVSAADITEATSDPHEIVVTFGDNIALDINTIDGNDDAIVVLGADGFEADASFVELDGSGTDTLREANYQLDAPAGGWEPVHSGTYIIALRDEQVSDVAGNHAEGGAIGTFNVALGLPVILGPGPDAASFIRYTDASNTDVTIRLNGGEGELIFVGDVTAEMVGDGLRIDGDDVTLERIDLTGTTARDTLQITGRGGDGVVEIGSITSDDAVGRLVAPQTVLTDQLTIDGPLNQLHLHHVDGADVTIDGALHALALRQWDGGSLEAETIHALRVAGGAGLDGHFSADVTLHGAQNSPRFTLAAAAIVGDIEGGTWSIDGDTGRIVVRGNVNDWSLSTDDLLVLAAGEVGNADIAAEGDIVRLVTRGWDTGTIEASTLAVLASRGDFGASLSLNGDADARFALLRAAIVGDVNDTTWDIDGDTGRIVIRGDVNDWSLSTDDLLVLATHQVGHANVMADGDIVRLLVRGWDSGTIDASTLAVLASVGDFGADLSLAGDAEANPRFTLTRLVVRGDVTGGMWQLDHGDAGVIAVTGGLNVMLNADARVHRVVATGDVTGSIDAASLGVLVTRGDLRDTDITLRANDPQAQTLDRLVVGRTIDNTRIDTSGSVGNAAAGAMHDSRLLVGLHDPDLGSSMLPTTEQDFEVDFDALAQLRSVHLLGLTDEPFALSNSNVVSGQLHRAAVRGAVDTDNGGEPFGFYVHEPGARYAGPEADEDYVVRIL